MKIKTFACIVSYFFLCTTAHSARYFSETFEKMRFELECSGQSFETQEECAVKVSRGSREPFTSVFKLSEETLLSLDRNLLEDLSNQLQKRANNKLGGLPLVSQKDKDDFQRFDATNMNCRRGQVPNGATFIWCSVSIHWPDVLAFFVVGTAALPMLMYQEK